MSDETEIIPLAEDVEPRKPTVHDARTVGRPSDYRLEFCKTAADLAGAGATDEEIAQALDIHPSTLYRWFAAHPEFREAVKLGKEAADDRVERSLYHRAVGYTHEAVKIMQYEGSPVLVRYTEHVAPDPGAAFNWLKNRRPADWRDRKELTGADGGAIRTRTLIEFVGTEDSGS